MTKWKGVFVSHFLEAQMRRQQCFSFHEEFFFKWRDDVFSDSVIAKVTEGLNV